MTRRHLLLFGGLMAALLVRVIDPWKNSNTVAVVGVTERVRHDSSVAAAFSATPLPPARWTSRRLAPEEPVDPFAAAKPVEVVVDTPPPPPPPAAPPAAPAPPSAPPMPFTAVGDWTDGNNTMAFLAGPNGLTLAKAGDTIGGSYRVDKITRGHATLTYLPLQQTQQLTWSSTR
jgi:hypothetical protein